MISSTRLDLPDHLKQALDACLRLQMLPIMMDQLPADDSEAISASYRLVDESDIYVGVFAYRYGYVPQVNNPRGLSITEMEYERAVERNIPRFIFLAHDDHLVKVGNVETGEGASKLLVFKERLQTENIVNWFKSPDDLRANIIHSLSEFRQPDLTTLHFVGAIPEPPVTYIAHPYTLLQSHRVIGRHADLKLLTDWVTKSEQEIYQARILNIVAMGGMGKSSLTWKWFNEVAPQKMKPLSGQMWWSFYESDATFENFVMRALAYVTRQMLSEVQNIPSFEREVQLLSALDREPFLIVLDGLERTLVAYARIDAPYLAESQVENKKALRRMADLRAGRFLKKLAQIKNSRILVSSRLFPSDLETHGGDAVPGTFLHEIQGLTDEDAVNLWRAFGVSGSRDELVPLFTTFGKHPLLIQALAGEIKRYRRAPGDFEEWRKGNPGFDPARFRKLLEAMAHVLEFALRGLDDRAWQVLRIIAAFRMSPRYDTLAALLMGEGKACSNESELDVSLTELEDRGLLSWDKRRNSYDLHPVVRGVVWNELDEITRRDIYGRLHAHFQSLPSIEWRKVGNPEDLTPTIELYNTLIGLGRYDDAFQLFSERLKDVAFFRLAANRQTAELLQMLFPDGIDQLPRLSQPRAQADALNALADASGDIGYQKTALSLFRRSTDLYELGGDYLMLGSGLMHLGGALRTTGDLRDSEMTAYRALLVSRRQSDRLSEAKILRVLGMTLAARGKMNEAQVVYGRAVRIFEGHEDIHLAGAAKSEIATCVLRLGDPAGSLALAESVFKFADELGCERCTLGSQRRRGLAALALRQWETADWCLKEVLDRARAVNLVREELYALIGLADLQQMQDHLDAARELLDAVWDRVRDGPYRLLHTDALNSLARIEQKSRNATAAIDAATDAYKLAWCDGPPFAYHWGLDAAKKLLHELGAPEPELALFDETRFEPMPAVEIDPDDEFHASEEHHGN